jgi:hypothetical protein
VTSVKSPGFSLMTNRFHRDVDAGLRACHNRHPASLGRKYFRDFQAYSFAAPHHQGHLLADSIIHLSLVSLS